MKANCKALFGLILGLSSAVVSAQIAPSNQGDVGLFTMPTADTARPGQFTLGLYGWKEQLVAAKRVVVGGSVTLAMQQRWSVPPLDIPQLKAHKPQDLHFLFENEPNCISVEPQVQRRPFLVMFPKLGPIPRVKPANF